MAANLPHPNPPPPEGEASEWVDAWLWPEGEQLRWWTAADTVLLSHQEPARLLEKVGGALASSPVRLHLTEDWPVEKQRAFHDPVAARPILRERCQFILAVPRTAAPRIFPSVPAWRSSISGPTPNARMANDPGYSNSSTNRISWSP